MFSGDDLHNFAYCQVIPFYILYIFGCLINIEKSPIETAVSVYIISIYSYFIHVVLHKIPMKLNLHNWFHHYYDNNTVNLFIELLLNLWMFGFFYIVQRLLNINVVSNKILIYYTMVYVSGHIINYSVFKVRNHEIHHKTADTPNSKICNYGPDVYDHFFGTNYDDCWENYTHLVPNIVVSFLICYYLFYLRGM